MNKLRRHALSDEQWARIEELFPSYNQPGGRFKDHRVMLDGMMWILKTGAPWRDLPERFGAWETVYSRFRKWSRIGFFAKIVSHLQADLEEQGLIDWELFCIDGTNVRAHKASAGAKKSQKSPKNRKTTPLAALEAASLQR